ncbi:hypothetical protein CVIRNUC_000120 [Coccomyxa viridis]|uniref:Uncharacterized protein n=1 Tax=Coccomyxa viridis TaxID=1274662 RepID=A0AAV1HPB4_9CHLO|nr:hypothetical protein CVIRNUC_000120 [Coccomyxa viridis]
MYRRPGYPHEATPHPCNLRACCRACLRKHRCGHRAAAAGLDRRPRQPLFPVALPFPERSIPAHRKYSLRTESVKPAWDCVAQLTVIFRGKQDPRQETCAALRADCTRLSRIAFPERLGDSAWPSYARA